LTQNEAGSSSRRAAARRDPKPDSVADAALPSAWPDADRRGLSDRRHRPTPFWSAFLGPRRRHGGRRHGETDRTYVDRFTRQDIVLVVAILVLNVLDALFTLVWLQRGGSEGNPIMAWILELGNSAFLIQKTFVVGLWLMLLVVHKNFRLARVGLWALAIVYSLLVLYHVALIASGVDPRGERDRGASIQSEQPGDQRWYGGLDAQGSRAEADRPETRREKSLDLVIAPTPLRSDRE
jgi:hypothetical protein